jgi:hypothetical protein
VASIHDHAALKKNLERRGIEEEPEKKRAGSLICISQLKGEQVVVLTGRARRRQIERGSA